MARLFIVLVVVLVIVLFVIAACIILLVAALAASTTLTGLLIAIVSPWLTVSGGFFFFWLFGFCRRKHRHYSADEALLVTTYQCGVCCRLWNRRRGSDGLYCCSFRLNCLGFVCRRCVRCCGRRGKFVAAALMGLMICFVSPYPLYLVVRCVKRQIGHQ